MYSIDPQSELTNATIQKTLDGLAATGGGVLEIPAGTYTMYDALHLRSGVRVVGEQGTILRRAVSVMSPILDVAGYGFYEFTVQNPELFRPGMGVYLTDDNAKGFYTTVATITHREGNRFFVSRMLNHDYRPNHNAKVRSLFPIVDGYHIENASLENVILDGNSDEKHDLNGCRGGGVFLLGTSNISLLNLEVRHYAGDGISFQQCVDTFVRGCEVHAQTGSGLHPGSGSVRYIMEGNNVHHNGTFGIFYCLRTSHSICENNIFHANGLDGISVGERDTHHWIRHNTATDNGGAGLNLREAVANSADQVRFENNILRNNCRGPQNEAAEIIVGAGIREALILNNSIENRTCSAIWIAESAQDICFHGNEVNGRHQIAEDVIGNTLAIDFALNENFPAVGPEALPLTGAHHLFRPELKPWTPHN